MIRKIEAMHRIYGTGCGKCKDCPHIVRKVLDRTYYKCLVYGDSNSEATDWRLKYPACGLIDKPFPEEEIRVVILLINMLMKHTSHSLQMIISLLIRSVLMLLQLMLNMVVLQMMLFHQLLVL